MRLLPELGAAVGDTLRPLVVADDPDAVPEPVDVLGIACVPDFAVILRATVCTLLVGVISKSTTKPLSSITVCGLLTLSHTMLYSVIPPAESTLRSIGVAVFTNAALFAASFLSKRYLRATFDTARLR